MRQVALARPRDLEVLGLFLDIAGWLDAEGQVVGEGDMIAAIDAPTVMTHGRMLPRPVRGRVPVGDVMMLVAIALKAQGGRQQPFPLPGQRLLRRAGHRRIVPRGRSPGTKFLLDVQRIPLPVWDVCFFVRVAASATFEVAGEL